MSYAIGTLTKGGGDDVHYQMLGVIKDLAEDAGWTTLRYETGIEERELILHSTGLSGTEDVFIGFKAYQSVPADFYNLLSATFVGYVAGNTFEGQPGYRGSGVACHNNAATYFLTANAQRITGAFKVGTPVFSHFYQGKFLPYMRPGEYPSPLVSAGMLDGRAPVRFSETQWFPYKGIRGSQDSGYDDGHLHFRDQAGNWKKARLFPFANSTDNGSSISALAETYVGGTSAEWSCLVPAGVHYQPVPIILHEAAFDGGMPTGNVYGELDGVVFCSGFNNTSENVLQVGGSSVVDQTGMTVAEAVDAVLGVDGRAFVVIQDWVRTSWRDFVALEMS